MNTKHTAGAVKAAVRITRYLNGIGKEDDVIANIIEEETHTSEMLAFIERVATWDFGFKYDGENITAAQQEAFALIEKVSG